MKSTLATAILPIALGLSLLGCTQDDIKKEPPSIAQQSIPPEFQVRAEVKHHPLNLLSEAGDLSTLERHNLDTFIAEAASGKPEAVHVRVSGIAQKDTRDALVRVLVAEGVEPSKIEFAAANPLATSSTYTRTTTTTSYNSSSSGTKSRRHHRKSAGSSYSAPVYAPLPPIDVAAEVYKTIPPACPRTSRTAIAGVDNGLASNWGCSYVSVFEQMVVDPRDLVHGEGGATIDSEVTSGAIDRMRKDKLKPLTDTGSVTLNSTSSSGGGQ